MDRPGRHRPRRRPGRRRASAQAGSSHPDWIPASPKPPKRGGLLTRASAWDPPVIDPRLTQSVGLYQFAGLVGSRLVRYAFPDEVTRPLGHEPQGRPRGVVDVDPRRARVDLQAAPGREVAQRGAAQRPRVRGRRREVLPRGVREGGRAVLHLPGGRGHRDAGQVHRPHPPQDAQRALPAERGGADHGDVLPRGAGGGRRSQEAHDRDRPVPPEGAQPQGPGDAHAQSRLLGQGPPVRGRVRDPLDTGRGDPDGRVPHRAERLHLAREPLRGGDAPQDERRTCRCTRTTTP